MTTLLILIVAVSFGATFPLCAAVVTAKWADEWILRSRARRGNTMQAATTFPTGHPVGVLTEEDVIKLLADGPTMPGDQDH